MSQNNCFKNPLNSGYPSMNTKIDLTALITGASSGLGLEFVHLIAAHERWDKVVLVARREERLIKIIDLLSKKYPNKKFYYKKTDLVSADQRNQLFEFLEKENLSIDCLINNAGFGSYGFFQDAVLERQIEMINLNCTALMDLSHRVLKDMLAKKKGYILNVSSMASFQGLPYLSVYGATKAFVTSFSLALATELKDQGITVQALCPGPVPTEFLHVSGFPEKISVVPSISAKAVCELSLKGLLSGKRLVVPGILNKLLSQLPRLVPRALASDIALNVLKKKF